MTPEEQAQFIALWEQGAQYPQIAESMGISQGTVASRARSLQQRGLIQPRERGGFKPRPAIRDTSGAPPAQAPGQAGQGAGQVRVLPPERAPSYAVVPLEVFEEILKRFDRLEERISQGGAPGGGADGPGPGAGTPVSLPPSKSVRWKMSLPSALLERIREEAKQRAIDPSRIAVEGIFLWLERHASPEH